MVRIKEEPKLLLPGNKATFHFAENGNDVVFVGTWHFWLLNCPDIGDIYFEFPYPGKNSFQSDGCSRPLWAEPIIKQYNRANLAWWAHDQMYKQGTIWVDTTRSFNEYQEMLGKKPIPLATGLGRQKFEQTVTRAQADKIMNIIASLLPFSAIKRYTAYRIVRWFGWVQWNRYRKQQREVMKNAKSV